MTTKTLTLDEKVALLQRHKEKFDKKLEESRAKKHPQSCLQDASSVVVAEESASSEQIVIDKIRRDCLEERLKIAIDRPDLASMIESLRKRGVSRLSDIDSDHPGVAYFFVVSVEVKPGKLWIKFTDDNGQPRRNFIAVYGKDHTTVPSPGDLLVASVSVKQHWKSCKGFKKVA